MTIKATGALQGGDVSVETGQSINYSTNLSFLNDLIIPAQRPVSPHLGAFYGLTYYQNNTAGNCDNGNCTSNCNCGNIQCNNCTITGTVNCTNCDTQSWLQTGSNCACTYNCTTANTSYNCNCNCNCSKIICAKLHEYGLMDSRIWAADQAYGRLLRKTDKAVYRGYIRWARFVTDWMSGKGHDFMFWVEKSRRSQAQQSYILTLTQKVGNPWSRHMAFLMGAIKEDDDHGRVLMTIGRFFCKAVNYIPKLPRKYTRSKFITPYSLVSSFAIIGLINLSYLLSEIVMFARQSNQLNEVKA